jgi:hypothetical protein
MRLYIAGTEKGTIGVLMTYQGYGTRYRNEGSTQTATDAVLISSLRRGILLAKRVSRFDRKIALLLAVAKLHLHHLVLNILPVTHEGLRLACNINTVVKKGLG